MNYYEIYDAVTGDLVAHGNSRECREALGCASMDSFYALANRTKKGINKKYKIIARKGGETPYPVLGKYDPIYDVEEKKRYDFAEWMFNKRKELGITQAEMAKIVGMTTVSINRYENRFRVPAADIAKKIAERIGSDINEAYEYMKIGEVCLNGEP